MNMNRIQSKLQEDKKLLSIYFTAGYPKLDDTVAIIESLEKSGVDMIEWRYRHVATTLDDGRILITGGNGKNEVLAEAELFVP